jgi:hypothetical protein
LGKYSHFLLRLTNAKSRRERTWQLTAHLFDHDDDHDFTKDFTASTDQDYITMFIYNKGQGFDRETAGKKASRAIVELCPYNFADKPTYRTYQTDSGKNIIPKLEYSPVKRFPLEQKYQAINRFTYNAN